MIRRTENCVSLKLRDLNSDFRRDVDKICAVLGYYAASCGNCLPTFRDNVSVPSSRVKKFYRRFGTTCLSISRAKKSYGRFGTTCLSHLQGQISPTGVSGQRVCPSEGQKVLPTFREKCLSYLQGQRSPTDVSGQRVCPSQGQRSPTDVSGQRVCPIFKDK
jgi:hypothetical protein